MCTSIDGLMSMYHSLMTDRLSQTLRVPSTHPDAHALQVEQLIKSLQVYMYIVYSLKF